MDSDKQIKAPEVRMPAQSLQEYVIEAGHELRISAIENHIKVVMLEGGQADVFGRELPPDEPTFFSKSDNIAIFCWKRTQIKVCGAHEGYQSDNTHMHRYVNLTYALNQIRTESLQQKKVCPGLLVTGAQQSGKKTLSKILTNYAIKLGWQPTYVDLDLKS